MGNALNVEPLRAAYRGTETMPALRPETAAGEPAAGLFDVLQFLKRRRGIILVMTVLGLLAGFVFLMFSTPYYVANTRILIDTRHQDGQSTQSDGAFILDTSAIDSQIELIKSRLVVEKVLEPLKLYEVPDFNGTASSPWASFTDDLRSIFGLAPKPVPVISEQQRRRIASAVLLGGVGASRVGRSYIIQISFRSTSREWAAKVANAIGEAYIDDQLDAKYTATKRATLWLQERINELRSQANLAEREVLRYRADNNIIDLGQGTLASQQLNDAAQQMMKARAELAESKVRLDRISEIFDSARNGRMPDATVAEINNNPIIARLRSSYVDIQKREADISARFGRDHIQANVLRTEMRGLQESMINELRRVVETVRSEYEIAQARETGYRSAFDDFVKMSTATGEAKIPLRELEATAQSFRGLYDSFLAQQAQANQRITFPRTEARVIAPATPPWLPSEPNSDRVLLLSLIGGCLAGFGLAFAREQLDRVFRTPQQVERYLGVECLGILPKVDFGEGGKAGGKPSLLDRRRMMRHVIEKPFSRFSETLRSIKVTLDLSNLDRSAHVIGFVSGMPNEGKTTVASNFAALIASSGQNTVLIDMDLRNPSLTKRLAPDAKHGLIEVLSEKVGLGEALIYDPATKVRFLPTVIETQRVNTNEIVGSAQMKALIKTFQSQGYYVVLDLPPLSPVVDARAAVQFVNHFILVIEWGQSRFDVLKEALKLAPELRERIIGAVLNKTNMAALKRYDSHREYYYENKYYSRYGYEQ
jgi:polysaccharide biosynthesis transport protein